jgi:hypothetical protein
MSVESAGACGDVVYSYRPSLFGPAWEFRLSGDGIDWTAGTRSGRVPFANIRRLRMSYRPMSMQSHRFTTEIWAEGAPKLQIVSTSWKSMVEQQRQDQSYSVFISELHRRIAAPAAPVRCEQGANPFLYWPGLIVFVGLSIGLAGMVWRALQENALGGAAFVGAFVLLFLWQGGNFFRRNRPGFYRPDAPPAELMPKA